MYAIVSIAGQQFKVEKGKKVFVHRLPGEIGDEVSFDKVLLISNNEKVNVGAPYLPGAIVLGQIVSHLRGDKVLVFKKKRRKTYQTLNGHRQYFTEIMIEDISETGEVKKTEKRKAVAPKEEGPEAAAQDVKAEAVEDVQAEAATTTKAAAKKTTSKAASSEDKPKKASAEKAPASVKKTTTKKSAAKSKE